MFELAEITIGPLEYARKAKHLLNESRATDQEHARKINSSRNKS